MCVQWRRVLLCSIHHKAVAKCRSMSLVTTAVCMVADWHDAIMKASECSADKYHACSSKCNIKPLQQLCHDDSDCQAGSFQNIAHDRTRKCDRNARPNRLWQSISTPVEAAHRMHLTVSTQTGEIFSIEVEDTG